MTDINKPSGAEPFDLRALIRDVAATSASPDPVVVAKEVERRIDPADAMTALSQALPVVVYHTGPIARSTPDQEGLAAHGMSVGGGAIPLARRSLTKQAVLREAWRRELDARVSVAPGHWKFLRDCTASDLGYSSALKDRIAAATAASAARERELAAALNEYDVTTVGELPDGVLARVLGGGAAA